MMTDGQFMLVFFILLVTVTITTFNEPLRKFLKDAYMEIRD